MSIEQIRSNTSPRPLSTPDELDRLFVETGPARDERTDFRDNLKEILCEEEPRSILVHGHRGCGKSTELNKLLSTLGEEWLIVRVQSEDFLQPSGNEAADVLLAASVSIVDAARRYGLSSDDKSLEQVQKFFSETTKGEITSKGTELETGAGVSTGGGLLGPLIGLRARIEASLKFGSRTEESTVYLVRRRRGELANAFTALCLSVENAWKKRHANGRMLLIVEELDKLGLADARKIFVEEGKLLASVPVRAIYTIPVFTFLSPDARAIRSYFGHSLALPMVKVREANGETCHTGRVVLTELVRKRVPDSAMPQDALDHLLDRTGGVLRDIFLAIQTAITFKAVKASGIIGLDDIKAALDRMVSEMGNQIAYPPEEGKDPEPLRAKLREIAALQREKKTVPTQPDQDVQYLLMSGALLEYNGTGWLGVHPLALSYLESLPHGTGPQPA